MSTAISGLRVPGATSADLEGIKTKILETATGHLATLQYREIGERAAFAVDRVAAGLRDAKGQSGLDLAVSDWESEQAGYETSYALEDPFRFEAQLYVTPTGVLAAIFALGSSYREQLLAELPHAEDYSYWNGMDHPDHVTDAEWQARRDEWDTAIGETGVPADRGTQVQLGDETRRLAVTDPLRLAANQPGLEQRQNSLSGAVFQDEINKAFTGRNVDVNNISDIVRLVGVWRDDFQGIPVTENLQTLTPKDLQRVDVPQVVTIDEGLRRRMRARIHSAIN